MAGPLQQQRDNATTVSVNITIPDGYTLKDCRLVDDTDPTRDPLMILFDRGICKLAKFDDVPNMVTVDTPDVEARNSDGSVTAAPTSGPMTMGCWHSSFSPDEETSQG